MKIKNHARSLSSPWPSLLRSSDIRARRDGPQWVVAFANAPYSPILGVYEHEVPQSSRSASAYLLSSLGHEPRGQVRPQRMVVVGSNRLIADIKIRRHGQRHLRPLQPLHQQTAPIRPSQRYCRLFRVIIKVSALMGYLMLFHLGDVTPPPTARPNGAPHRRSKQFPA